MVDQIKRAGELHQSDAADIIQEKFGEEFVYENENGNPAISRDVLAAFRRLTEDWVVWERSERYWRRRERDDQAGRQQDY